SYDWQGTADLKTYRTAIEYLTGPADELDPLRESRDDGDRRSSSDDATRLDHFLSISARLRQDRLELATKSALGGQTSVQIVPPANYIPGAWLWSMLRHSPIASAPARG